MPSARRPSAYLLIDIGSTFTKGLVVDAAGALVRAFAEVPTTSDVMVGVDELTDRLDAHDAQFLACSSAGGGLRLAVVGYEDLVTAEAGRLVGLSAGAKVVHVAAGELDDDAMRDLAAATPDVVLLVGGADGGNADVILHNAGALAAARLGIPVVLAGNLDARDEAHDLLDAAGPVIVADNVLPEIGRLRPLDARRAIREVFLRHVIGGKGLSADPRFTGLVRTATPDAVRTGVELLADAANCDVLVVDVGGATTDVYSVVGVRAGADPSVTGTAEVTGELRSARTVEGDLGVRWNARSVVEAADRDGIEVDPGVREHADWVHGKSDLLPATPEQTQADAGLAATALLVAIRRHGRAPAPGATARDLQEVGVLVASGGVFRHTGEAGARAVAAALADQGAGWLVPRGPRTGVDTSYLLLGAGLLLEHDEGLARRLAGQAIQMLDRPEGQFS